MCEPALLGLDERQIGQLDVLAKVVALRGDDVLDEIGGGPALARSRGLPVGHLLDHGGERCGDGVVTVQIGLHG